MIIVKFQGGLGNQLFQYVFYKKLEYIYPQQDMKADLSYYYRGHCHQGFELEKHFGLKLPEATWQEIFQLIHQVHIKSDNIAIRRTLNVANGFLQMIFKEKHPYLKGGNNVMFHKELLELSDTGDYYLEGFWCNEKYFKDIYRHLKKDFSFLYHDNIYVKKWLTMIESCNSVSIHIRHGDYVGTELEVVGFSYYLRAIKLIRDRVNKAVFFVFSDDVEYIKQEFSGKDGFYIIDGNREEDSYLDMLLMSSCQHNIITNSTFSYWGAYLNDNENKIVVCPDQMWNNQEGYLSAEDWLVLESK